MVVFSLASSLTRSFSSTARLRLRIDCEVKKPPDTHGKATVTLKSSDYAERTEEVVQGAAVVTTTSYQPQAIVQGAAGIPATSYQPQAIVQGAAGVPATSNQPQAIVQGAAGIPATSYQPQAIVQGAEGVPVMSNQPQAVASRRFGVENHDNRGIPTTQAVLNFIAISYFQTIDPSNPEERNGFWSIWKTCAKRCILAMR